MPDQPMDPRIFDHPLRVPRPAKAGDTDPARTPTADHPLHCAEVLDLITEFLEEALAEADRLLMEAHLEGCEDCRIRLAQLQLTIELIGRAGSRMR